MRTGGVSTSLVSAALVLASATALAQPPGRGPVAAPSADLAIDACGVATNFVVESTARYAADADYRVIVLEDCCGAFVREEHESAIRSLDHLVEVATSADFLASLPSR